MSAPLSTLISLIKATTLRGALQANPLELQKIAILFQWLADLVSPTPAPTLIDNPVLTLIENSNVREIIMAACFLRGRYDYMAELIVARVGDRSTVIELFIEDINTILRPHSLFMTYSSSAEYRDRHDILESFFLENFLMAVFKPRGEFASAPDGSRTMQAKQDWYEAIDELHTQFITRKTLCSEIVLDQLNRAFANFGDSMMEELNEACQKQTVTTIDSRFVIIYHKLKTPL